MIADPPDRGPVWTRLRRRRLFVAAGAAVVVAAAVTAAVDAAGIANLIGIGDEATYHASTAPAVTGSFPDTLACTAGAEVRCGAGMAPYSYELVSRVEKNSGGSVGAGSVDGQGRRLRPPAGVPAWITCDTSADGYACRAVERDAELPEGAPIYQLAARFWVASG